VNSPGWTIKKYKKTNQKIGCPDRKMRRVRVKDELQETGCGVQIFYVFRATEVAVRKN
jgi:hypothetical protein